MKDTLQFIAIISITFILAMSTSILLDFEWIEDHWLRQTLVVLLIILEVVVGAFVFYRKAEQHVPPGN